MMRLFYGAGTEKTKDLLMQSIKEDLESGRRVVLLVPEQEAVITEQRMLRALPPRAQLSFEVLNFSRLANRVFRTVGGLSYRYASPAVTNLTMWRVMRRLAPSLRLFGEQAGDRSLTERMLSAVAQCKAYCIPPEKLAEAADMLPESDPLKNKLFDISLVLGAYSADLSLQFDDVDDDLSRAADLIAEHRTLFADTDVYVDSFTDFTRQELRLLELLMKTAASFHVTTPLLFPNEEGVHLASSIATVRQLSAMAKGEVIVVNDVPPKASNSAAYVAQHLFKMDAAQAPLGFLEDGHVHLIKAASPYAEAEYVANTVRRLVGEGYSYRDFTIVARDTKAYLGIIDAALEKESIPFYISEKTDITTRPLVKLILFALRIQIYHWRREDVVGFLKTGLCRLTPEEINFFEEYTNTWHLCGKRAFASPFTMNPDGYKERVSSRGKRILDIANEARAKFVPQLMAFFDGLAEAKNATEACRALYGLLLALDVPSTLKKIAEERLLCGERREAEELSRLYGVTVDAMEAISNTVGEDPLTVSELYDALCLVFSCTDIGVIPTSADEVMIGSAATLRAAKTPIVFVMGLNEGVFPAAVKDNGIFSDTEKHRLKELDITLSADNATAASDELFYLYRSFSLAEEKLYLSFNERTTSGKAAEPSIAVARVKALLNDKKPISYEALPVIDKIFSPDAALEHYAELSAGERKAISALFERDESLLSKKLSAEMPVIERDASITPDEAAPHFGEGSLNPTGIEKFVSCKFAYYCNRVLALREEANDTLSPAEIGTFMHYVFEHVLTAAKSSKKQFDEFGKEEIGQLVDKCVADYRAYLTSIGGALSPRASALVERLRSLASIAARVIIEDLASSPFTPAAFEIKLSDHGAANVPLNDNTQIALSGRADRVDVYRDESGTAHLRIIDYKTGNKTFTLEGIENGEALQMPLYLYALCEGNERVLKEKLHLDKNDKIAPGGLLYFSTAIEMSNTTHRISREEALESASKRLSAYSGITLCAREDSDLLANPEKAKHKANVKLSVEDMREMFGDVTATVSRIANEMRSGSAAIAPNVKSQSSPCNYCKFFPICRAAEKTSY